LYYPGGNETSAKPNLITCITEIFLSAWYNVMIVHVTLVKWDYRICDHDTAWWPYMTMIQRDELHDYMIQRVGRTRTYKWPLCRVRILYRTMMKLIHTAWVVWETLTQRENRIVEHGTFDTEWKAYMTMIQHQDLTCDNNTCQVTVKEL
jgi:hypothetical protein